MANNIDIRSLIKNNTLFISQNHWQLLNQQYNKNDIKLAIIQVIRQYNLQLPFPKPTYKEMENSFQELIALDETKFIKQGEWVTRYDYKYQKLNEYLDLSNVGMQASNYFHIDNRLKCDSINSPSPYRVWGSDKFLNTLLNFMWSGMVNPNTDITLDTLKTAISLRKYVAQQFKPSVAKYIYNKYAYNGDVLDFSAGWGDRLCAFYASNAKSYVGIDPNVDLFDGYKEQIKTYFPHKPTNMICSPAENFQLNEKFDLIFTSPPYFDVERYNKSMTQSYKKYKKIDQWLNNFLFKTIGNFWNNLNTNGHLIINISDVYCHHTIQKMCDPMNDYIATLNGARYIGALGMRMAKRPNTKADKIGIFAEPMWIWRKI